ncbi:Expansin-A3 [Ranunculus cassubicifolius]
MMASLPLRVFTLLGLVLFPVVIAHDNVHPHHPQLPLKHHKPKFKPGPWCDAHATFYGSIDGGDTMGGACGYENLHQQGYGLDTAAISPNLFNEGATCGACYEIKCINSPQWCIPGSIQITATNLCPPNWQQPSDNGGWCNPPRAHFDLAQAAFLKIAQYKAGIVPVSYRRVPCHKQGGIKFTISGNPYFTMVLVWNVGGAGDVQSLQVKGQKTGWVQMKRNWGQKWHTDCVLTNQSLSFRVTASDGRKSTAWHVAPPSWQFGQTFEGKNFR